MSDPKCKSQGGFDACSAAFKDLSQVAHDHDAVFCLETYVNHVVGSVEQTVKMCSAGDHPGPGPLMDPTNYFEAHTIDKIDLVLNQVFDTLAHKVKIAHAKDVARAKDTSEKHADIGDDDTLASRLFREVGAIALDTPGTGVLNCDLHLQRLARQRLNIPIIVEHLDEADAPRSKRFLEDKMRAHGL